MEDLSATISTAWEAFTTYGTQTIQKIVLAFSDYEMTEFAALAVFYGIGATFLILLLLWFKRPKKVNYLMEGGSRYYRP